MNYKEIMKKYERLYNRLKSECVEWLRLSDIPPKEKVLLERVIRELPHPSVANVFDIYEVCRSCTSGILEGFYKIVGEEAHKIRDLLTSVYGSEFFEKEAEIRSPPELEEIEDLSDAIPFLKWTGETLFSLHRLSLKILKTADITLKGRCPYCGYDLVEVLQDTFSGIELRLRCRNEKCKGRGFDWLIAIVKKVPRP